MTNSGLIIPTYTVARLWPASAAAQVNFGAHGTLYVPSCRSYASVVSSLFNIAGHLLQRGGRTRDRR
jgi:hypothetical protein